MSGGGDDDWQERALALTKDVGLRQALRHPVFRNILKCTAEQSSYSAHLASLCRRFRAQILAGCSAMGKCSKKFCRSNPRYTARLVALGPVEMESLVMGLAIGAVRNPDCGGIQPHAAQQQSDVANAGKPAVEPFAARFNRHVSRLLLVANKREGKPAETPDTVPEALLVANSASAGVAVRPMAKRLLSISRVASKPAALLPVDCSGHPLVAVSWLDSRTAPVVGSIGGRLLRNTVDLVFGSSQYLMHACFVSADGPLGIDTLAAVAFACDLVASDIAHLLCALRRGVAGLAEELNTEGVGRALALVALVLAVVDDGRRAEIHLLQMRIGRLILRHAYSDAGSVDTSLGWQRQSFTPGPRHSQWLHWWATVPAAVLRQWLSVLKADALGSTRQLQAGLTSDYAISRRVAKDPVLWSGALELQRLLYESNQLLLSFGRDSASDKRPLMPVSTAYSLGSGDCFVQRKTFVDMQVLGLFDLADELQRWIRAMRVCDSVVDYADAGDRWAAANIFSPFAYPFLFDFASKQRLLVGEMHSRMAMRYLRAHDRQAELVQHQRVLGIDAHAEQVVNQGVFPEWPLLSSNAMAVSSASNPFLVLAVRRPSLVQDAFDMLDLSHVRFPLRVRFVAGGEDGVDMGGVQKEFFAHLLPLLLAPDRGLFEYNDGLLWPSAASPYALMDFESVGVFLGLAFANNVAVDAVPLAPALVSQLAYDGCKQSERAMRMPLSVLMRRLRLSFPSLVDGLQQLLDWDEADGSVQDVFCRSFEATVPDPFRVWHVRSQSIASVDGYLPPPFASLPVPATQQTGSEDTATFPLIRSGGSVDVTAQNRDLYVSRYLQFMAYEHASAQISALRRGFARAMDSVVYRMLTATDLVHWFDGYSTQLIDVQQLQQVAEYDDEYTESHPVVRRFWRVISRFDQRQLRLLLAFVTASDRLPLAGYRGITFVVQRNGPDSDRLPTALTCFGRLLLPAYASDRKMQMLLLTAIENCSGFGLV
ncbi:hypothetical protein GGF39_001868 [Coemansia sp. RSA 1721]|nr:hypothetical protein GGF39_001868 [Coemansia sp. RSA 1721]